MFLFSTKYIDNDVIILLVISFRSAFYFEKMINFLSLSEKSPVKFDLDVLSFTRIRLLGFTNRGITGTLKYRKAHAQKLDFLVNMIRGHEIKGALIVSSLTDFTVIY